jgi:cytochrome d ubiquinol oxidase subunit I
VSAGNVAFSTLGYCGLYFVIGLLFVYLVGRHIQRGPTPGRVVAGLEVPSHGAVIIPPTHDVIPQPAE